jgi:dihydroorotate dehydrogenase electron transfer subunit
VSRPADGRSAGLLGLARRDRLRVLGSERIGPYVLLSLERGALDAGAPGQFFMLEAPDRLLPRPMSLCLARRDELGFLFEPVGSGTRALAALARGDRIHVFGPLGNGFHLAVERPLLVAGGIGVAPMPYLWACLDRPRALLGFRSAWHAEVAALVPGAEVVVEPRLVTEALPADAGDILACGPEPMLEALAGLAPDAQLAWEAPMACGYGACYACVIPRDGRYVRLCVEGPVFRAAARRAGHVETAA